MEPVNVRWYVEDVSSHCADIAIEGLPGVGHVGKLVADHLVNVGNAVKIAEITSTYFPPQMYLTNDAVLRFPRNEVFFVPAKDSQPSYIVLAGDCQSTSPEGHYVLAEAYVKIFELLGVKKIYTLGGYGVGHMVDKPRVLAALSSTDLKDEVVASGAVLNKEEPVGGIIGAAGLLITFGRLAKMSGAAFLGETSGYLVDPVASKAVLDVLEKLTGISVDKTSLNELAEQMLTEVSAIASSIQNKNAEDLSYIG
ncbi:MAG: proteasome assembly chaperone family protein [Methanocorpusculum sp.]|nr:proteasome assembly chaperone family protein [Methanocorpusculum sp.]